MLGWPVAGSLPLSRHYCHLLSPARACRRNRSFGLAAWRACNPRGARAPLLEKHKRACYQLPGTGDRTNELTPGLRALCPVSRPQNPGIMLDDGAGIHAWYMQ